MASTSPLDCKLRQRRLMKHLVILTLLLAPCITVRADDGIDIIIDAEGVRRTGTSGDFSPGTRFIPTFATGGGIGGGMNFELSDHVSLEGKLAAMESHLRVRNAASDFVVTADLGKEQIYPATLLLQWRTTSHGTFRPYVGAGVGHVVLRNIRLGNGTEVRFKDPTGLVLDAGFKLALTKRFFASADLRYLPVETSSRANFGGGSTELNVRPLIGAFGIAWHF